MAKKPIPCPTLARLLLTYEPDTGKLFWKERKPWMFNGTDKHIDTACKGWNRKWAGKQAFTGLCKNGYLKGCLRFRTILAHRAVWAVSYGYWPSLDVDHINCIKTDNRLINLRLATRSENKRNVGLIASNTSGFKGVSWHKSSNKWRATIRSEGKQIQIGKFPTLEGAYEAYCREAKRLHGDFARLE